MAIRDRPIRVHLQMEHREVEDALINRLSLQQMAKSLTQIIPERGRKEANTEGKVSQRRQRSLCLGLCVYCPVIFQFKWFPISGNATLL